MTTPPSPAAPQYAQAPSGSRPGWVVGLIVSIVALVQSKRAGYTNGFAVAGIIIGALSLVGLVIGICVAVAAGGALLAECQQLGSGVHDVNGVTYACN